MSKVNISPGRIAYRDEVEYKGCTYSIDKLRIRIPLLWSSLRVRDKKGKEVSLSDERVISGVSDILFRGGLKSVKDQYSGRYLAAWSCFDFPGYLFLQKFKPFGSPVDYYSCIIEFNPNKVDDLTGPHELVAAFKKALGDRFLWDCLRCDYALDIPGKIEDFRILSRKSSSSYLGTYYFGIRGKSGYTRVYDKRKEYIDHYSVDIGSDVTRFEWEAHTNVPFTFDIPYKLGDLRGHDVLRYVPMDMWSLALQSFDKRTAKKIRETGLIQVPFDPGIYRSLYDRLINGLGLDMATIRETIVKQNQAQKEEYENMCRDLDLISAEINRWAKDPDYI